MHCANREEFTRLLQERQIVHGVINQAVDKAISLMLKQQPLPAPLLLACSTSPIPGRHGIQPIYATQSLLVDEADEDGQVRSTELLLTPLVQPGDILAEHRPPAAPMLGRNIRGIEYACPLLKEESLHAGDLVTLEEDSQRLIAQSHGYPVIRQESKGTLTRTVLCIEPLVRVTPDKMQALLCLRPPPFGHTLPSLEAILALLDQEQITFGRLPHAITRCLAQCDQRQRPQQVVAALGTLPVKGKDAWLRFEIEIGPLPGKVMGNGEIDFRERNMFIGIGKDQLIAVRIPPTQGTPGRDVYGAVVEQTPGKDIAIRVSDDAAYNQETGEIRASRAGVLSMVSEGTVKVCSRQIINQDIDFRTGNVVSRDALEIRGSIRPKFKVNALGDILIRGVIEKAQVRSDSNVVVQEGGLIGDMAVIRARGDVDVPYVEFGRVYSAGTIILRKSGYCCRLHSGGHIHCDSSSRIIASQVVAAGSVTAGTIGSDNADASLIAAAVAPEQFQLSFELRRAIDQQGKAIEAIYHRLGGQAHGEELDELYTALEESRKRLAHLNLIFADDHLPADRGLSHAHDCFISIRGRVQAGTEIRIGNSRMILPMTMNNVSFRLKGHSEGDSQAGQEILMYTNTQ